MLIRLSGGEALIGLPPLVYFPGYAEPDEEEVKWVVVKENLVQIKLKIFFEKDKLHQFPEDLIGNQ